MKNLLDDFLEEYFCRPSGIVCYSVDQHGGVCAAMPLRTTLAELGMSSIPGISRFILGEAHGTLVLRARAAARARGRDRVAT